MTPPDHAETLLEFSYRNWRGEVSRRTVLVKNMRWGASEYHPDPQWLLKAFDIDKQAYREFAVKDMSSADPDPLIAPPSSRVPEPGGIVVTDKMVKAAAIQNWALQDETSIEEAARLFRDEIAAMEHHGDCTKAACTCIVCFRQAELDKARAVLQAAFAAVLNPGSHVPETGGTVITDALHTTAENRDEIARLSSLSSRGPWRIEHPQTGRGHWIYDDTNEYVAMFCRMEASRAEEDANAALIVAARTFAPLAAKDINTLFAENAALKADHAAATARHISEWHEGIGAVLWWTNPVTEAPYVGSPLDLGQSIEITIGFTRFHKESAVGGWPGYHEWWMPLPAIPAFPEPRP